MINSVRVSLGLLAVALLAGCAGTPPVQVGADIPGQPGARAVQTAPAQFTGRAVRWGGEILAVHNAAEHTDVEIYDRALYADAEPRPDGGDQVRFIARMPGFIDPVEYAAGKRLTVRGTLLPAETGSIGEYDYLYPTIAVEGSHLWPVYEPPEPGWYYDPWYRGWPYHPWGPWGRYRHPYWW